MALSRKNIKTAGFTIPSEVVEVLKSLTSHVSKLMKKHYQEPDSSPMKSASRKGRHYKRAEGGNLSSMNTFGGDNTQAELGALGGLGIGVIMLQLLPPHARQQAIKKLLEGAGGNVADALVARNLTADRLNSFWETISDKVKLDTTSAA